MARKMMTKEVTFTTVKASKMAIENGTPVALPLEDEIILGNVTLEVAQRHIEKKHGKGSLVFEVIADTKVYEMSVEEFMKVASVKEEEKQEELQLV